MPTWPSELKYDEEGYSWTANPGVSRAAFHSNNTRQRLVSNKRDDVFSVTVQTDSAGLLVFENFVKDDLNNGADTYDGPYYVSDVEKTGTLRIIEGTYQVNMQAVDIWTISFQFEVVGRDFTDEEAIVTFVNDLEGFPTDLMVATEDAVNNNTI